MNTIPKSPVFRTRLLSRTEVAERTMAFHFEKPADWTYKAGQFVDMTLIDPSETDDEGNTRSFSLASSPGEPTIMIATRLRDSACKRVLRILPLNTEVQVEGPFGDLHLHNDASRPAVFLAGGIGITPVRSIVTWATGRKLPHRIYLLYANRRPEDAPFLEEMTTLERENPNFKFVPTMTRMDRSALPWDGETGRIDERMLRRYLTGVESAIYYITGPAAMVSGVHTVLNQAGIDDDDIRMEEFLGY